MTDKILERSALKAACLAILDAAAVEHSAGHQGKLAARYLLRSSTEDRIGLMFEKSPKTAAYLWVDRRYADRALAMGITCREYPAADLYAANGDKITYGRHAALKKMRDLAHADLVRLTITDPRQISAFLTLLKG